MNYTAPPSAPSLTLAWDKAGTTSERITHPYRYFIAGGETLKKIEDLIAGTSKVNDAAAALAAEVGAKSYDVEDHTFQFDFDPADLQPVTGDEVVRNQNGYQQPINERYDRISPKIPDFVLQDGRSGRFFCLDERSQRAKDIAAKCEKIRELAQPMQSFAKWLGCYGVDTRPGIGGSERLSAHASKFGEQWVVAVPVVSRDSSYGRDPAKVVENWAVPPDSTQISVSDYFALAERHNHIQNMPPPSPGTV